MPNETTAYRSLDDLSFLLSTSRVLTIECGGGGPTAVSVVVEYHVDLGELLVWWTVARRPWRVGKGALPRNPT